MVNHTLDLLPYTIVSTIWDIPGRFNNRPTIGRHRAILRN